MRCWTDVETVFTKVSIPGVYHAYLPQEVFLCYAFLLSYCALHDVYVRTRPPHVTWDYARLATVSLVPGTSTRRHELGKDSQLSAVCVARVHACVLVWWLTSPPDHASNLLEHILWCGCRIFNLGLTRTHEDRLSSTHATSTRNDHMHTVPLMTCLSQWLNKNQKDGGCWGKLSTSTKLLEEKKVAAVKFSSVHPERQFGRIKLLLPQHYTFS